MESKSRTRARRETSFGALLSGNGKHHTRGSRYEDRKRLFKAKKLPIGAGLGRCGRYMDDVRSTRGGRRETVVHFPSKPRKRQKSWEWSM